MLAEFFDKALKYLILPFAVRNGQVVQFFIFGTQIPRVIISEVLAKMSVGKFVNV